MRMLVPFEYEFFRRGLFAAILVGALCGYIGVYVVLRRMSYIGHGLSHAIFGGAVLSYITHSNFYIGAGIWALFSGALIHAISRRRWVGADAAIGVVTTTSFAIGVSDCLHLPEFHTQHRSRLVRQHSRHRSPRSLDDGCNISCGFPGAVYDSQATFVRHF